MKTKSLRKFLSVTAAILMLVNTVASTAFAVQVVDEKTVKVENEDISAQPRAHTYYYYTYDEIDVDSYLDYTRTKEITSLQTGGQDTGTVTFTQIEAHSFTSSFSISLTADAKNSILSKIQGSYSAAWSASNSTSEVHSYVIGAGKRAQMVFTPYVVKSTGTLKYWAQNDWEIEPKLVSSQSVTSYAIRKLGSFAYGEFDLKYA